MTKWVEINRFVLEDALCSCKPVKLNLDSDKITLRLSSNEKQFRERDDRTTLRFHSSNAASIIPVFSDQRNDYKPETLEENNGKEPSSVD